MEVTELRSEALEWDAFVRTCDEGTPFHLVAWRRAVEETFGLRAHYLLAHNAHGIEGVLPLFEARSLLGGKALISVPYATYGGICATSGAARRALADAAAELGRRSGTAYIELRQRRDQGLGLVTKSLYVTFSRAISKADEDNALAIPRKQRRMTRQGEKRGLRIDLDRAHFDAFYDIYAHSLRNLGSPVFPRTLLRTTLDVFDKDAELLTIWHGDQMVAGVMSLLHQDQILPYYAGALRHALPYAVNDFMYWELMRHAARTGYRVFDFGRSRQGSGAYHFKRHWGFTPVPLPYQYILLTRATLPDVSPSNARLAPLTHVWKRLPLAFTNALGPLITRYLP